MKTMHSLYLTTASLFAATTLFAAQNAPDAPKPEVAPADASTNAPAAQPVISPDATNAAAAAAQTVSEGGTNLIRLNFRAASLDQVLNYFSEAAGYTINIKPGTSVRGRVDVWSNEPLTRDEALNLLDTVLIQNGLAAIRNGKTLSIVNKDEAKTQQVPVISESNPDRIPLTDKICTYIIPVRFVEVGTLVKDLQPLVSVQTSLTGDEAGNSIIITDTQANVHKVAEIVRAVDMSAEDFTELRVFTLAHADPTETANLLTSLFPDDSRTGGGSQSPFSGFGGGGGRFGRMMAAFGGGGGGGQGGGNNANGQSQRIKKRNRVIAVADQRTASVVVSANRDLMEQIENVIKNLDPNPKGQPVVRVFDIKHANPQELETVISTVFPNNSTTQNRNGANNLGQTTDALTSRQSTQVQQNNNSSTRSTMTPNSRGGGSIGSFGQ